MSADRDNALEDAAEVCRDWSRRLVYGKSRTNKLDRHAAFVLVEVVNDILALKAKSGSDRS